MNELTLQRIQYGIQQYLSERFIQDAEVRVGVDEFIGEQIIARVRFDLFSKDAGIYTYQEPKTWWDHLKKDSRFVRKLFGSPEYKYTKLMLRCVLDPRSRQLGNRWDREVKIVMTTADDVRWDGWYNESEVVEYEEMQFYPTIYKMTE